MYPRHRLDLKPRHLVYAAAACVWAHAGPRIAKRIEDARPDGALVCFSVRSAFELLLEALELPRHSEVLMSAITHPDMARIAERHGLVPVPVDLDLDSLGPRLDLLERAVTHRTRAFVIPVLGGCSRSGNPSSTSSSFEQGDGRDSTSMRSSTVPSMRSSRPRPARTTSLDDGSVDARRRRC
jgi:hypothetical protein